MPIQVSADGFELTSALKESCEAETKERLLPISLSTVKAKWVLSVQREEQVAHLIWNDGIFHGDVTVKTTDMYSSIHQCAKKASEQMKKSHEKKQNHHKTSKDDFHDE
ncbi:MAG: HPF/RaiA family ribosome-associated protein [Bdellovibrionota bacterium]